jgi:hypothetical protein
VRPIDARTVTIDRFNNVLGILHSVYVADFVAIVGGNGNFVDAKALVLELDDDFRVEVEIVRHLGEINTAEGVEVVGAVAGVEFGEIQIKGVVFEKGEDLVSDVLVKRHAAPKWAAEVFHHPGAEDSIGFASDKGMVHVGEDFRGVLSVTMEQDDDVEAAFHEVLIAQDLIAAIALVLFVLKDMEFGVGIELLVAKGEGEGFVLAGIVEDDDLFDILPDDIGDTAEDFGESGSGVVSNDQNPDPFAVGVGQFGRSRGVCRRSVHLKDTPLSYDAKKELDIWRRYAKKLAERC